MDNYIIRTNKTISNCGEWIAHLPHDCGDSYCPGVTGHDIKSIKVINNRPWFDNNSIEVEIHEFMEVDYPPLD